jgi:hypothetical protein
MSPVDGLLRSGAMVFQALVGSSQFTRHGAANFRMAW